MGRLFRWIVGLLGALAVWRLWSRRRREAPMAEPVADPADELRRKLAATRDDAAAAPPDEPEQEESLEERRSRVHAKALETIDAMHEDET